VLQSRGQHRSGRVDDYQSVPFVPTCRSHSKSHLFAMIMLFDAEDLPVECADFLNRITRGDRVDEKEAFTYAYVLLSQGTGGTSVSHEKL